MLSDQGEQVAAQQVEKDIVMLVLASSGQLDFSGFIDQISTSLGASFGDAGHDSTTLVHKKKVDELSS